MNECSHVQYSSKPWLGSVRPGSDVSFSPGNLQETSSRGRGTAAPPMLLHICCPRDLAFGRTIARASGQSVAGPAEGDRVVRSVLVHHVADTRDACNDNNSLARE